MSSVLFLATEWDATRGGINALNRDLVQNCGLLCKNTHTIACAVLQATDEEIDDAAEMGVSLISLQQSAEVLEYTQDTFPKIAEVLNKYSCRFEYIVGHDIFTGPMAVNLATLFRSKSVVIIHTDYSSFKSLQDGGAAERAHEKEAVQADIVRSANIVMGIGPQLTDYARDLDGTNDVKRIRSFVPGLPSIEPLDVSARFPAITFGRYDERNQVLKQHQLCVEGFCEFVKRTEHDRTDKTLTVIGLSSDPSERMRQMNAVNNAAQRVQIGINIPCRAFLPREETWNQLRRSALGMMLSWREGFGLAGWETIAAGVPLMLSKRSGLFQFLDQNYDHLSACFYTVDVRGSNDGSVNPGDVEEVAYTLKRVFSKRDRIRRRATIFLDILKRRYSWRKRARVFLRRLDRKEFRAAGGRKKKAAARPSIGVDNPVPKVSFYT